MPKYVKFEDIKQRLIGKVRFDTNEEDDNIMDERVAKRLIDQAEAMVEIDLSERYEAPFVSKTTGDYKGLPTSPTKNIIKTLCELKSVMFILDTDFGAVNSDRDVFCS